MKQKVNLVLRILLGLMLVLFGANKFGHFIPMGEPAPEVAVAFGGLMAVKFILPTVGVVETLVGLVLLSNRFVSLALVVLVPISYSIVAFHLAFDPAGIGGALFVAVLNVYLLLTKKENFNAVLTPNS